MTVTVGAQAAGTVPAGSRHSKGRWRKCVATRRGHHGANRSARVGRSRLGPLMTDATSCRNCGEINRELHSRFCGRCGALFEPASVDQDEPGTAVASTREVRPLLSRRDFVTGTTGLLVGGIAVALWARQQSSAFTGQVDPAMELPEATFVAGDARQVSAQIKAEGPLLFPSDSPRVAVVIWDPAAQAAGQTAAAVYGEQGQGHPVVDFTGLMALSLKSTHLGCRVPYCASSGWFEDPCHGSKWNRWGEWTGGPAPRGLDRFRSSIRPDGTLVVDLTVHHVGPPREPRFDESEPVGPFCLDV